MSRDNPCAWLMATAKHRAIDLLRRNTRLERKYEELARELEVELETVGPDLGLRLERPDGARMSGGLMVRWSGRIRR